MEERKGNGVGDEEWIRKEERNEWVNKELYKKKKGKSWH